jgi:predicted LPLAT superfamily acyltransferase
MTFKPCAIVPSHNHHLVVADVVNGLQKQGLSVFVVDDGSLEPAQSVLANLHAPQAGIFVTRLDPNRGKGAAVSEGFRLAHKAGFSHAIQVDADGQHDASALPSLIELAKNHPLALISGKPIYDDTIPKSRLIARWLTHVWVWVETLSFQIKDSMCGYRAYPLDSTLKVIEEEGVGQRMDFDTEIMVRLFWRGVPTIMTPVKVTYPENNTSNFDIWGDNWRITKMHTRLVLTMLFRLPRILRSRPIETSAKTKWASMDERGMAWGLKFLATTYKTLGYRACWVAMQPVLLYFFLTGSLQRKASQLYWEKIYTVQGRKGLPKFHQLWTHYQSFGHMALDKLAAWMGDIQTSDLIIPNEVEIDAIVTKKQGILVIASHLGNIEICRALSKKRHDIKITVFAHTKHAVRFNQLLSSYNKDAAIDVVQVDDMGPATAIELQERLAHGEWIVIAGDRTPVVGDKRLSHLEFLGKQAPFSQGPMILASLLQCPVYSMMCLKEDDKFRILFEKLSDQVHLPRKTRAACLDREIQSYVSILEQTCQKYPDQWYNFFDFWDEIQ